MSEHWKPVVGWEGLYEVSDHGRVRSIRAGIVMRPDTMKHGHMYVYLSRDGKQTKLYLHRAVLEAFVGPAPAGTEGCHWNGDPSDNTLPNLRWGTKHDQRCDDVRNGVHAMARRTHCPRAHALVAPNLVACEARKGYRSCLACNRARAVARRLGQPLTKALADREHERIMAVAS